MSYTYKNITDQTHLIAVLNESRTDVSHIPVSPGAKIEVAEPTLDVYLPHILARMSSDGSQDITSQILRQNEDLKKIALVDSKKKVVQSVQLAPVPTPPVTPIVAVKLNEIEAVLPKMSYQDAIKDLPPVVPGAKVSKSKRS